MCIYIIYIYHPILSPYQSFFFPRLQISPRSEICMETSDPNCPFRLAAVGPEAQEDRAGAEDGLLLAGGKIGKCLHVTDRKRCGIVTIRRFKFSESIKEWVLLWKLDLTMKTCGFDYENCRFLVWKIGNKLARINKKKFKRWLLVRASPAN